MFYHRKSTLKLYDCVLTSKFIIMFSGLIKHLFLPINNFRSFETGSSSFAPQGFDAFPNFAQPGGPWDFPFDFSKIIFFNVLIVVLLQK
jgi:hypothetical protein